VTKVVDMKNDTRRELLTKLGIGAAAVVAVAATPKSAEAAPILQQQFPKTIPKTLPGQLKLTSASRVQLIKPIEPRTLQVRVAVTKAGVIIDAAPTPKIAVGLSKNRRLLQLGVQVDSIGGISVLGLNSLVQAAAEAGSGRCNGNGNDKLAEVGNPADLNINVLKSNMMARF